MQRRTQCLASHMDVAGVLASEHEQMRRNRSKRASRATAGLHSRQVVCEPGAAREQKRALVDSALLVGLRPLLLGVAVIIVGAAAYRASNAPLGIAVLTLALGLIIAGLCLAARRLITEGRISARWAHPLAALLVAGAYAFVLYVLAVHHDTFPEQRFVGLTLLTVMTGSLFLHLRWLAGMVAFIFVSWTAMNLMLGLGFSPAVFLFLMPIIAVSAFANYAARKQAISRMIDAQLENDLRNAQLVDALERAHQSEARLDVERGLADQVLEAMAQGLVLLDEGGAIEFVNPAAAQILGAQPATLAGRPIWEVVASGGAALGQRIAGGGAGAGEPVEISIEHGDGRITHSLAAITFREGGGIILNLTDLTLRKEFEARLQRLAHYDALTGLANRSLLNERAHAALLECEERAAQVAVLFLDLDRFKPINDMAGHDVGDLVLIQIANRIQECVRARDTVARIGGDEFVILLADVGNDGVALEIAQRIAQRVQEPIFVDGRAYEVSVSIGVATNRSPRANPDDLIRLADIAMYKAKRHPGPIRIFYDPAGESQSLRRSA